MPWKALGLAKPFYLFIPQNEELREEYEQGWKVTEIFPVNVLGFQSHRDGFAIAYEESDIEQRVKEMLDKGLEDTNLTEKYAIKDGHGLGCLKAVSRAQFSCPGFGPRYPRTPQYLGQLIGFSA